MSDANQPRRRSQFAYHRSPLRQARASSQNRRVVRHEETDHDYTDRRPRGRHREPRRGREHRHPSSRSRSPPRRAPEIYADFFSPEPQLAPPRRTQPARRVKPSSGGHAFPRAASPPSRSPLRRAYRDKDGILVITCPIDNCDTLLYPSPAAEGTDEYRCLVNKHGRVALSIDGEVELVARTVLVPKHVVLPLRVYCAVPLCKRPVNSACGRKYCRAHCLLLRTDCGERQHDKFRSAPDPEGLKSEEVDYVAAPRRLNTPPTTPVGRGNEDRPRIERATVHILFMDRDFAVEATVAMIGGYVSLDDLNSRAQDLLHLHEIDRDSLEIMDKDGNWIYDDGTLPIDVPNGLLRCRARTLEGVDKFPLLYYSDMAERIRKFQSFITDREPMTAAAAFECLFEFQPLPHDLDTLNICRGFITASPRKLRKAFASAGPSPRGTWSAFVHACLEERTPADLSASDCHDDDTDLAENEEDVGHETPTRWYAARRRRPAWAGPPASEASSSRQRAD